MCPMQSFAQGRAQKKCNSFYISVFLVFCSVLFCFALFVRLLRSHCHFQFHFEWAYSSAALCMSQEMKNAGTLKIDWDTESILANTKLHESAVRARTLNFQRKIHEIHGNAQLSHLSSFHFRAKDFQRKFPFVLSGKCNACCSGAEIISICIRF